MKVKPATNSIRNSKIVIVGSGFYGATIAEKITSELGQEVTILESRNHVGGNAHSFEDEETGIEIHKYGSHLFHTSNKKIWDYINQFDSFNEYRHSVWANAQGKTFSMPINLATLNSVFAKSLSPDQAKKLIADEAVKLDHEVESLEDFAISKIGKRLYELLIKGYTWKQWETDPKLLPAATISRLPIRFNFNTRYFSDTYEGLPIGGYRTVFQNMLKSELIDLRLETDFFDVRSEIAPESLLIYTGAIDKYFDYSMGQLSWRTLDFEFEKKEIDDFQGCAVMNYADIEVPYTRIHEFKHLHPERKSSNKTIVAKEFSRKAGIEDEPYYPINTPEDRDMLESYRTLTKIENNVIFGGRLGTYQYLDMHMAIGAALSDFENIVKPWILMRAK